MNRLDGFDHLPQCLQPTTMLPQYPKNSPQTRKLQASNLVQKVKHILI